MSSPMNLKYSVSIIVSFVAGFVFVQPSLGLAQTQSSPASVINLKQQALSEATKETDVPVATQNTKSRKTKLEIKPLAAVQEPLQLSDSYLSNTKKNFWKFGMFLEPFQTQGTGQISNISTSYSLNQAENTWLPSLRVGREAFAFEIKNWQFQPFLSGGFGYVSQELNLTTPTGSRIEGRLNSARTDLRADLLIATPFFVKLKPKFGLEYGRLFASYSSDTSVARWTESVDYSGFNFGLNYEVNQSWEIQAQLNERQETAQSAQLDIQTRTSDIGLQYKW
jgi:hypothetical protein